MSYDLFFRPRSPEQSISQEDFSGYFSSRRWYNVKEIQAWYSNEDTGVYFSFDYSDTSDPAAVVDRPDSSLSPVSFNLNYFRPHVFALEAEPEVEAFVEVFDLFVSDPQDSGMGDAEYSNEGFLRGWNDGNEFAYRAMLSQDPTLGRLVMSSSRIESCWRWNYHREKRQDEIEVDAFVPTIFFFDEQSVVRTGVIWGDGIPILLPVVDYLLVPRKRLAPRRLFRSKDDIVLFHWKEMEPIIRRFEMPSGDPECYELFYEAPPADIEQKIRGKDPPPQMPKAVPFDEILDQELVEKARAAT